MRKAFARIAVVLSAILVFTTWMHSQTVQFNDSSVIQANSKRVGLNIGALNNYDSGQLLKNLVGSLNPGFEPLISQQIWVLDTAGSTTSFNIPSIYYAGPANYWTGGTFTVTQSQSGGAELGCTGTILTSGAANYPNEPAITISQPCAAAFAVGDVIVLNTVSSPTPETWWENNEGGFTSAISNGGKLTSDTTDLCATCGNQALEMDATASGSTSAATFYFDAAPSQNVFVLMNGTFQISFWAKSASQSPLTPTVSITAQRFSSSDFSCGPYTLTPATTWTLYTYTCTASEQGSTVVPSIAYLSVSVKGGAIYLDNVALQKVGSGTNTTVLRDEVIAALQRFYATSSGGKPGAFRYWLEQNAETMSNWTKPDYAHAPTVAGNHYYLGPTGSGAMQLSLEDYLLICQAIGAEPYLEVPVTFSTTDASGLIDFLAGSTSTAYGAQRSALGQAQPWTSVFPTIHLSFCNECWNNSDFSGQDLAYRASAPTGQTLYDYSTVAKTIFAAIRGNSAYTSSSFDLVMNAQTAINYGMDAAIQRAQPDSIELADYMYGSVSDYSTDSLLWTAAMVEPWDTATDASDPSNFYQSVHDYQAQSTCGPSGNSVCNVNLYEWGQSTQLGSIDQQHLDYITAGAGQGVVSALQALQHIQTYGIVNQSYFALAGFENAGPNSEYAKLWGNTIDMGGATNNVRPQFLTLSLINQSIIGSMYSCPITSNAAFNFAGESNNGAVVPPGSPALNNVPLVYAFCFENAGNRSVVLINTDLTSAHSLSFAGTDAPFGSVTVRQYAPSSLDSLNEAPTGQSSNTAPATVYNTTSTITNPASFTLPPHSVTALDYSVALAGPSFSLPAGTYPQNESVSLSDPVSGTTIYYTTDGSTPTTSSAIYTSPIKVASTETISAIAVSSTLTSSVSTALYTVYPTPATPLFSISSGTYSYGQTVTISDSTSGAVIYYTTDGSTPTTTSTVYSGPITLTSIPSETLSAIAVANTISSTTATAQYTVNKAKADLAFYPSDPVTSGAGAYFLVQSSSTPTPSGAVSISINGQTFQSSSQWYQGEVAIYEISATSAAGWVVGNNTVTASFAGDSIYAPQTLTATVAFSLASTTTSLSASATSPVSGSSVTLTATVSPAAATGTVTFLDGTTTVGAGTLLNGVATYTVSSIAAGAHSYTAVYGGNSTYATSTSASISVSGSLASSTTLAVSNASPVAGSNITLTATTSPSAATGTVTFMDGTASLGTATLSGGVATYTDYSIASGAHSFTAVYGGNSTYATSTSSVMTVTASSATAVFTISVTNPVTYGSPSTLTLASSQFPTPTGAVTFQINGVALASSSNWSNGRLSVTLSSSTQANGWTIGNSNTVTAAFAADSIYAAQTVTKTGVVFNLLSSTTALSASNTAPSTGSNITLTSTTSPSAATGTVTFLDGTTTLGTGTLSSGVATYTVTTIAAGAHSYTAVYGGSSSYVTSTSSAVTVTAMTTTATALTSSTTSTLTGSAVVLTSTTSPSAATGTVTFLDGTTTLGTGALSSGVATYTVASIAAGTHSYTAVYGGSSTYATSTSSAVTVTAASSGSYLSTTFNEYASGHALNGTAPAVDGGGGTWSDPNGDWTYGASGAVSSHADLTYPTLINLNQASYAAAFTYPAAGAQLLFRYVDSSDYLMVQTYSFGEIVLYSIVGGTRTALAEIYPSNAAAALTVTLSGATGTISCGGQTASATIPSTLLNATQMGFFPPSASFVIGSINVTVAGGGTVTSTTTALSASNTAPSTGSNITLTATTSPSAATGTVTFLDGTTTLGTGTLSSGVATYTVSAITAGAHSYTAVYGGSSTYATSTSSAVTVTAGATATTTALSASSTTPAAGSNITLTSTTSPSAATGTVTFLDGTTTLGTGTLSSGVATYTVTTIAAGAHSYTAVYGGSTTYATSTSSAVTVTAGATATTTALSASSTAPSAGSAVVLTSTTSPSAATGTVTFLDGTTTLGTGALSSGVATYTVASIAAGTHSYTAVYGGSSTYATSTSSAVVVTAASSGSYLSTTFNEYASGHALNGTAPAVDGGGGTWSDPNGDWTYGASGAVSSHADLTYPTLINLNQASYAAAFTYPAAGAQLLFRYVDSSDYLMVQTYSFGEIVLYSIVGGNRTALAEIYPSNAAAALTVTLSGATGTISCGGQTASATIPSNLLNATQMGFFPPSASFVIGSINVTVAGGGAVTSTTTALSASNTAPSTGSNITLTATTSPSAATGTVTFLDGTTTLGTGTLSSGVATYTVSAITAGSHSYTAVYGGSSSYATSTSSAVTVTAGATATTTTLSASNKTPSTGSNITLTSTTSPSAATGTVTFLDGTTTLGTGTLSSGVATYTVSAITAGAHSYTAVYGGSSTYATSTSSAVTVTAGATATTTTLSASSTAPAAGSAVVLTSTTSPSAATGTVTFLDGTTTLGTGALSSGVATYTVASIAAGTHSYTAVYGGSSTYATSTSSAVTVTAASSGSYLSTTFNEYASGHALNGTAPAVDGGGGTWSDPNGDWTYGASGAVSSHADLTYPTLINLNQASYAAAFTYPAAGAQLLFRYVDSSDYLMVQTYSFGEIVLYSVVGGSRTALAEIYPSNAAAALTVTLSGATGTISCGGQTASATIPSTLLNATQMGFFPPSASFVIGSINVTVAGGGAVTATTTALSASNTAPSTGSNITLTATTSPSAATGTVTFLDGTTTLGTGTLSSGVATYTVSAITAGAHSYTAVYGGSSTYATSTSSAVTVTAGATATTTALSASSTTPAAGSNITLTSTTSPSAATGTVTFLDGTTTLGTGTLSSGVATYTVTTIAAGAHSYTAVYGGSTTYATSTSSAVTVTAGATATTTALSASSTAPSAGSAVVLTSTTSPSAATGTVTFLDGTTTLGTGTLSSGVATYTVASIAAGTHSYTTVYGGSSTYATSTSSAVVVTAASSGSYLSTTFNEYASGHALNGTAPAVDGGGGTWSDPNGDWTYGASGAVSSHADLTYPTLINLNQASYAAAFTYPAAGAQLLFRYVDSSDYLMVQTYSFGEIVLYSIVGGNRTALAEIYPSNAAAALTVTLSGSTGTISCGGQTASATIPSNLLNATQMGFFPPSANFVIGSVNVTQ